MAEIASADKSKDIECISFTDSNSNIFTRKLPAVGNIALARNTAFIAIEQVDESLFRQTLQILHTPVLMRIDFGVWFSMTPFSYVFVSSAKTFKKLRNVVRLAFYRLRLATRGTRHLCTLAMVVDVLAHRFGIAVFHHGLATTTRLYQQTGDTFAFVTDEANY